jgi:hypothetical protein
VTRVPSSYVARFAQLAALWAYAVSQHVFSLLEANPEFLVVRGATRSEVIVFALTLSLGPPAVASGCEWVASKLHARLDQALHLTFIGFFAFPLGVYLAAQLDADASGTLAGALVVAAAVVNAYALWRPVGLFLTYSIVLPALGLASFALNAPLATADAHGAAVTPASKPPVVVIVFDEFPVSSLMDEAGRVDSIRYPNFARLAREATWYPRATTVHEHTTAAVPAILTGRRPAADDLPTVGDHPRNLFTMLGESYRFHVSEAVTHLCPERYCPSDRGPLRDRLRDLFDDVRIAYLHRVLPRSMTRGLPPVSDRWNGFDDRDLVLTARSADEVDRVLTRPEKPAVDRLEQFVSEISSSTQPTLHFLHLLLPHTPWRYLPSGRQYGQAELIDGASDAWNGWTDNRLLVEQAYQRHLLQVGYTDRVLGHLLGRLSATGLYDSALVVVAADHGASFRAGGTRRTVSRENIADIARVPLFVKYPEQRVGRVDRAPVTTVDILPTIADVLNVDVPWTYDGRSLLARGSRPSLVSVAHRDGAVVRASSREVDRKQAATMSRKYRLFGSGSDSLFTLGRHTELLGREVRDIAVRHAAGATVEFDGESLFQNVRTAQFAPVRITGTIAGHDVPPGDELAVGVNGRVAGLSPAFRVDGAQRFSTLVLESTLRDGDNLVVLYRVHGERAPLRLVELGRNELGAAFVLGDDARSIRVAGGGSVAATSTRLVGRVERFALFGGMVRLRGWAADARARSVPDRILVFADTRAVYTSETTTLRWDVQPTAGVLRSGWTAEFPEYIGHGASIRVFALRGNAASELPWSAIARSTRDHGT